MYATFRSELDMVQGEVSIAAAPDGWMANWLDVTRGALHPPAAFERDTQPDEDTVSEHDLIAHLHVAPPAVVFLAEPPALFAGAGETITGAAFAAGLAATHVSGSLVFTFVDERAEPAPRQPARIAPFSLAAEGADILVLADRTTIRLSGLLKGWSRAVASLQSGPAFSYAG